jgi:hypothetical protein
MNGFLRRASVPARLKEPCEPDAQSGRTAALRAEVVPRRPTRRYFFRRMLRRASLVLLGGASGAVIVKRQRLLREGKCLNQGICRACEVFDDCGLPRALSTKEVLARTSRGG